MLKAAVYKTIVRPVIMYGSETWALRKSEQNWQKRTEMRMSRWMIGIKRIQKIRNEEIRARAGVANISEKIRETIWRWLGHVLSCLVLLVLCRTAFCWLSNDDQRRIAQMIDRRRRLLTTRPEVDR